MSNFIYGEHTSKHIGVWLRYKSNPDIVDLVKKSKLKKFFDAVERVVVLEYDNDEDKVFLQVWCMNFFDHLGCKLRYNVFYIKTSVNPNWVCEGDLGNDIDI